MNRSLNTLLEFLLGELAVRYQSGSLQHTQNGYRMARRTLATHNLIYVLRGRVEWVLDDQPVPFAADQWIVVDPGVPHHARSLTKRMTLLSFHWDMTLPGGKDAMQVLQLDKPLTTSPQTRLGRMLRMCREEYGRSGTKLRSDTAGSVGRSMLGLWSPLVVREMFREADRQGGLKIASIDPIVTQMIAWMHDHIDQPVNLETLETVSGYSAQHLNRMFRRSLGITAMKYFTRMRLERATELLRDGRLSVAAIAQEVGYESPFYFSRIFRQHNGMSPRQWQQAQVSD